MTEDTIDNKTIRKKRMRRYFVEAAKKIIQEEGIDGVTLRKVAKGAGYNGATLYNYFWKCIMSFFRTIRIFLKNYPNRSRKWPGRKINIPGTWPF